MKEEITIKPDTSVIDSKNETLVSLLSDAISRNWDVNAMSNLNEAPITYGFLAQAIARNHTIFKVMGLKPGDKVSLIGKNSVNWAVSFLSCLTYGVTCVPILHEFHPDSMMHLVDHSDSRCLFVDAQIWRQLDSIKLMKLETVINPDSTELLLCRNQQLKSCYDSLDKEIEKYFPNGVDESTFKTYYFTPKPDDLAIINYTSGSTGMSKGVMIPYRALWSNARYAVDNIPYLHPGDGMVSMLPLAHMFGMLVELIFPLLKACHITFLGKVPSPKVLLDAFAQVKPKLVVTVPLVIEKIVRNKVFPTLEKFPANLLVKVPGLNRIVYKKVKAAMLDAFGGNLEQLIIGGAALSDAVDAFMRKIGFPFTIGYGMTECAPLISYCVWYDQRPGSCGKVVDRMQVKVMSDDPANRPGTLWVKGENVMLGYYKNPEATDETFDAEGWMNTGDICILDNAGYLYIKGRNKTMILGPSGQNIYPEEIESKLNVLPFVAESLIVDREGKLVALIVPDYDAAKIAHVAKEKIDELMDLNISTLNRSVPAYAKVSAKELRDEPFEKTPKHSIRRYLYK